MYTDFISNIWQGECKTLWTHLSQDIQKMYKQKRLALLKVSVIVQSQVYNKICNATSCRTQQIASTVKSVHATCT